jgi:hypothetical protein
MPKSGETGLRELRNAGVTVEHLEPTETVFEKEIKP